VAVNIYYAVADFYALQALDASSRRKVDTFRRPHERWLQDFEDYSQRYASKFARALFDYLALACFGEARHCWDKASLAIEGLPEGKSRRGAYEDARAYNPWLFLPKLEILFQRAEWEAYYGGPSWARIAQAAQLYGKLPDTVFIDHCVDLSHNGGLCFDKDETGIFRLGYFAGEYRGLLDYKARKSPESYLRKYSAKLSPPVWRLVYRAANLGLVEIDATQLFSPAVESDAPELLEYQPVGWGDKELGEISANGEECYFCGRLTLHIYEVEDQHVCPSCFEALYHCDYCGSKVLGKVKWIDGHGYVCQYCLPYVATAFQSLIGRLETNLAPPR